MTRAWGRERLPPHTRGMLIGLYGGSFDPPHPGHRHVALTALRRLGLDRIWWLVTPRNPLKHRGPAASKDDRLVAVQALARHPRMDVPDLEDGSRSAYTVDTIAALVGRCPGVRFVWIMGADSLATFHRWRAWRAIAEAVSIAVVDRPGWTLRATSSPAALALTQRRAPEREAARFARRPTPAWIFLHGPRSHLSSTALRGPDILSGDVEKCRVVTLSSNDGGQAVRR